MNEMNQLWPFDESDILIITISRLHQDMPEPHCVCPGHVSNSKLLLPHQLTCGLSYYHLIHHIIWHITKETLYFHIIYVPQDLTCHHVNHFQYHRFSREFSDRTRNTKLDENTSKPMKFIDHQWSMIYFLGRPNKNSPCQWKMLHQCHPFTFLK